MSSAASDGEDPIFKPSRTPACILAKLLLHPAVHASRSFHPVSQQGACTPVPCCSSMQMQPIHQVALCAISSAALPAMPQHADAAHPPGSPVRHYLCRSTRDAPACGCNPSTRQPCAPLALQLYPAQWAAALVVENYFENLLTFLVAWCMHGSLPLPLLPLPSEGPGCSPPMAPTKFISWM